MKPYKSLLAGAALCVSALSVPAMAVDRPAVLGSDRSLCAPLLVRGVALTADQRLVCFSQLAPQFAVEIAPVTGFVGTDTALIGIDYRIQDGKLYGVGNAGGVYTVDVRTGTLSFVNALTGAALPLQGTSFGVDFNPAADRLRIVSNTGQNLRHNVNAGGVTIVDTALNNGAVPPVAVTGIVGAAYTNNDLNTRTGTTLFNISSTTDAVLVQSPANSGANVATATLLGATTEADVGFDIRSTTSTTGDSLINYGFVTLTNTEGVAKLYSVDLLSGRLTLLGGFSPGNRNVIDIAFPPGLAFAAP